MNLVANHFFKSRNLKLHIHMDHEGNKACKCDSCDKLFFNSTHLKKHINLTQCVKNHNCESCDISFFKAEKLKLHIHIEHKGNIACKCDSCGKLFLNGTNLKQHITRAHKPRDDIFQSKYLKTIHEGGRKKYKCHSCDKLYTAPQNFKY